jgi:NADH pyrophosphatase NudC (nudix superfamily)
MARTLDPAGVVLDQENLIQGVAKHFLERVYGPDGMPWGTKFSELEEQAVQIGEAVSRSMINQALTKQAQNVAKTAETCGVCGEAVQSGPQPESRAVTTTVGTAQWDEPKRYCPKCRAAFFPSVPGFGD